MQSKIIVYIINHWRKVLESNMLEVIIRARSDHYANVICSMPHNSEQSFIIHY